MRSIGKRILSIILSLMMVVGIMIIGIGGINVSAENWGESVVNGRDDGKWLFPLKGSYTFSDWAGCNDNDYDYGECPFHKGVNHYYGCRGASHRAQFSDKSWRGHNGNDIVASKGTPVYAAAPGKVWLYYNGGNHDARGKTIIIEHKIEGTDYSYFSFYQHLDSINVTQGQQINTIGYNDNNIIGKSGNTGVGSGAHLHFGIALGYSNKMDQDGEYLNTMSKVKWFTQPEQTGEGLLVTNPSLQSPKPNLPSVCAHAGSVTYVTNPNDVSIGSSSSHFKENASIYDVAFVVDTTGSMEDDINVVKQHMSDYLKKWKDSGDDYNVAIVDYRDFPEHSGYSYDYPYKVQLDFTSISQHTKITNSVNALSLGHGGDDPETVWSALVDGLNHLNWRKESKKVVIVMGDAPAHSTEPVSGYTFRDVVDNLKGEYIVDYGPSSHTSSQAISTPEERGKIVAFTIATQGKLEDFENLAIATGGKAYTTDDDATVDDIINQIIDIIPEVVDSDSENELTFWDYLLAPFYLIATLFSLLLTPILVLFGAF